MPLPAPRRVSQELRLTGTVAGVTAVLVVPLLRLWKMSLAVPMAYTGDANLNAVAVKSALEGGWGLFNPDLGAPFGQRLHDFPFADNLSLAIIKLVSLVAPGWARATNLFFLLTFPLTAVVALMVLRRLGISRLGAAVSAVLYALLPLHFLRGEVHLFLASYFVVPLGCYLALCVLSDKPLFAKRATGRVVWVSSVSVTTVVACVFVGSSVQYYALFAALLVAVAIGLRLLRSFNRSALLTGVGVLALVLGTFALNLAPTVFERWRHGPNREVGHRVLVETELYSATLAQLVLPVEGHRVRPMADLRARYAKSTVVPSEGSAAAMGLAASVGLGYLTVAGMARLVGRRSRRDRDQVERHLFVLALVALLLATTGGGSALIGLLLSPQLRAWNRMSVFIAFFALAALGLLLDRLGRWLRPQRGGAVLFATLCGAIVVVGALDQTTDRVVPDYHATSSAFRTDERFARAIERRLPANAAVFQLPYMPFPEESPFHKILDYDHSRPFLHTTHVRWSYGAMRNRPADWAAATQGLSMADLVPRLAAAGFAGVYVDRFGYADNGVAVETQLRDELDTALLVSGDGRESFVDLRPYASRLRRSHSRAEVQMLRRTTLFPARLEWERGFGPSEREGDDRWRWAVAARSGLRLVNPGPSARQVTLQARLDGPPGREATVTIAWGDGSTEQVETRPGGTDVRHSYRVSPGSTDVSLRTATPPVVDGARSLYVRVFNLTVTDGARQPTTSDRARSPEQRP